MFISGCWFFFKWPLSKAEQKARHHKEWSLLSCSWCCTQVVPTKTDRSSCEELHKKEWKKREVQILPTDIGTPGSLLMKWECLVVCCFGKLQKLAPSPSGGGDGAASGPVDGDENVSRVWTSCSLFWFVTQMLFCNTMKQQVAQTSKFWVYPHH